MQIGMWLAFIGCCAPEPTWAQSFTSCPTFLLWTRSKAVCWCCNIWKYAYLGTHSVISAIKKRTDVLQMGNDAIHSSVISDITVYKRSNECSGQLSVSNNQVFKSSNLQMFLKFLKTDRIALVYQTFYFILFRNITILQQQS